jgi:hypothetical protein
MYKARPHLYPYVAPLAQTGLWGIAVFGCMDCRAAGMIALPMESAIAMSPGLRLGEEIEGRPSWPACCVTASGAV